MPSASAWKLDAAIGSLRCGPLSAKLDSSRPDLGVHSLGFDGLSLGGHVLAVRGGDEAGDWPLPLVDTYVRGNDLVATYEASDKWPFTTQFYWSASALAGVGHALASLSLLISVETHLLNTWPRIVVSSHGPYRELLAVDSVTGTSQQLRPDQTCRPTAGASCVVHRLANVGISYAEIMPAHDCRQCTVRQAADGGLQAEWQLFADFLEKGVIRRARLQSVFLPRENDVQLALKCTEAMERQPLPLTT